MARHICYLQNIDTVYRLLVEAFRRNLQYCIIHAHETLKTDPKNLSDTKPEEIIRSFEEKWAPEKVARYIIESCHEMES